jgi:predicted Fe-Mo cluster-binding NifX family protein
MKANNAGQKIAVTVWEQRVSPVFDSARTLLIAEIQGDALINTSYLTFDPDRPLELLQLLQAQKVMTLICGAVSAGPANMLETAGIELISFIAGDVHRVLETFLQGESLGTAFKMPGCGKHICCRGKIRRGQEIKMLSKNGSKGKGRGPRCPTAVTNTSENNNDSVSSAEMFARLPGKS